MGAADRTREAMATVDRRGFLPADQRQFAAADQALPIGHGATCSQPSTVVQMFELLDPRPGDRVLDVGSGSGWTTALLAELVDPGGEVTGVEIEPALVESSRANLATAGASSARIEQANPAHLGLTAEAPFDRILVSAEADELPQTLVDQLADNGRMVVPVAGELVVAISTGGQVTTRAVGAFRFVPLRTESA